MKYFNKQKGLSLYLAIVIMVILLAIVLGAGAILLGQLKVIKGMENSVIAFYAADTGIERVLMDRADPKNGEAALNCTKISPCSLDNEAEYYIEAKAGGEGDCPAINNFCIRSVGTYGETKRAIEVVY